jgi:patatin-like phospholipase/acyl hydrolase
MFNILSLDGGGIRGLISATVVDYMEKYAYNYTVDTYCMPTSDVEKMSLSLLFDLVAGTSTGSLLATAIVLPEKGSDPPRNKYYAQDAIEIYSVYGTTVF